MSSIEAIATGGDSWDIYSRNRDAFLGAMELTDFDLDKSTCSIVWNESDERGLLAEYEDAFRFATTYALYERDQLTVRGVAQLNDSVGLEVFSRVGFLPGREFGSGEKRARRFTCDRYDLVRNLAEAVMAKKIDMNFWTFGYDNAKRRFGLCAYDTQHISVSRYLVDLHSLDETMQVVFHEVAHAMCGKAAGHGKRWLNTAKSLGYRAEKLDGNNIAQETANYVGVCPKGHDHYRFKKPIKGLSCGRCSPHYDVRYTIKWTKR